MRDRATFEYSAFSIENPLAEEQPRRRETFEDWYIHWDGNSTLKRRSGSNSVKCKQLVQALDGVDVFHTLTFGGNSKQDPLKSFLELHHLTEAYESQRGIIIPKQRSLYLVENASAHFTRLKIRGIEETHFSITGRTERAVRETLQCLNIKESNLNFGTYLQRLCSQPSETSSP